MDKIEYPKYLYSATSEQPALVHDVDEHESLGDGWFESPDEASGEGGVPGQPDGGSLVDLSKLKKADLVAHAADHHELDLDLKLTSAQLIEAIEAARAAAAKAAE